MSKVTDRKKYEISEHLLCRVEAHCERCNKLEEIVALEPDEAADGFYAFGWRVKNDQLLCKKCLRRKQ